MSPARIIRPPRPTAVVPREVIENPELSANAVRIYGLVELEDLPCSEAALSLRSGLPIHDVIEALKELNERGYLMAGARL